MSLVDLINVILDDLLIVLTKFLGNTISGRKFS